MNNPRVNRPGLVLPDSFGRRDLARRLIARLDAIHVGPGDVLTVEFPKDVYESDSALRDAEAFAGEVARVTGYEVIILREGTRMEAKPRATVVRLDRADSI